MLGVGVGRGTGDAGRLGGSAGWGGPGGARSGPGPGGLAAGMRIAGIAWQMGPMAYAWVNVEAVRFAISPGVSATSPRTKSICRSICFCNFRGAAKNTELHFTRGKHFRVFGHTEKQLVVHLHVHLVLCSRTANAKQWISQKMGGSKKHFLVQGPGQKNIF